MIEEKLLSILRKKECCADFSQRCYGRMQVPLRDTLGYNPVMVVDTESDIYHIDFSFMPLGQVSGYANEEYHQSALNCLKELHENGLLMAAHEMSKGGLLPTLLEMVFPNTTGGMKINLKSMGRYSVEQILFAVNPGAVVQIKSDNKDKFCQIMDNNEVYYAKIGYPCDSHRISVRKSDFIEDYDITELRRVWSDDYSFSPLMLSLGYTFTGKVPASISSGKEISVYLSLSDNEVTMSAMREALVMTGCTIANTAEEAHLLIYDETSEVDVDAFLAREGTLAIRQQKSSDDMHFRNIAINETDNIMLHTLAYRKLAIWTTSEQPTYTSLCCGRHLLLDGSLSRSLFPSQWGWYPDNRTDDDISPWCELIINSR